LAEGVAEATGSICATALVAGSVVTAALGAATALVGGAALGTMTREAEESGAAAAGGDCVDERVTKKRIAPPRARTLSAAATMGTARAPEDFVGLFTEIDAITGPVV
jgi:hypothetical protein